MSTERTSKIKIIDVSTNEVLYEFPLDKADDAYAMATQMEEMGLDIFVKNPSATETLCDSLGLSLDAKLEYEQSVTAEIDDHDGSCCVTPMTDSDKLQ
ncbi:MAG: hypothetical protein ACJAS4_000848 [Bacteriovoracaceae bacterium]|jgi:hypothetical protein